MDSVELILAIEEYADEQGVSFNARNVVSRSCSS